MSRFLILVVVLLFCVASSYAANDVNLQDLCKQTKYPSFCLTLLKSKPRNVGGDLVSLARYSIDVLNTDASATVTLIKKLIAQSRGVPKKQAHYKDCLDHFGEDGILGDLLETRLLLKSSDYQGVNIHMAGVMTNVDDCLSGDSSDTSLLPKYANNVNQVADVILIIAAILLKK